MKRKNKEKDYVVVGGQGVVIEGDIKATVDIVLSGNVNGNVRTAENITIGGGAVVNGNVTANYIIVGDGEVIGDLYADTVVELLSGAKVTGNIKTGNIVVDEGAYFSGTCEANGTPEE